VGGDGPASAAHATEWTHARRDAVAVPTQKVVTARSAPRTFSDVNEAHNTRPHLSADLRSSTAHRGALSIMQHMPSMLLKPPHRSHMLCLTGSSCRTAAAQHHYQLSSRANGTTTASSTPHTRRRGQLRAASSAGAAAQQPGSSSDAAALLSGSGYATVAAPDSQATQPSVAPSAAAAAAGGAPQRVARLAGLSANDFR
jgi:hypothetical protein